MAFRRLVAMTVAVLMAAPTGMVPLASAAQTGPASRVIFSAVTCFIANQFPQLEAAVPDGVTARSARAYFHSALSGDWFYVEGTPLGNGRYVFILPAPRLDAGPITYYIEFVPVGRTEDVSAIVVESSGDCRDRAPAAIAPTGPAAVFGPGGVAGVSPAGFGVATSASTLGAGVVGGGVAAAGGGVSTGLIVAAAALAAGVGVAVAVSRGDDARPSPRPSPPTPPTPPTPPPNPPDPPTPPPTTPPSPRPTPRPTPLPTPPPASPFR